MKGTNPGGKRRFHEGDTQVVVRERELERELGGQEKQGEALLLALWN